MRLVTPAQIRVMDRVAIEERDIPGFTLMEAAAAAAHREIKRFLTDPPEHVVVLCGRGNNGGDGFLVARHFLRDGARVDVFTAAEDESFAGDAARALGAWRTAGASPTLLDTAGLEALGRALERRPLVIDALLGTGFHGDLREPMVSALERLRAASARVVSLDIPSGVDGGTGEAAEDAVRADLTVTFALAKVGLLREPGRTHAGEVRVVDIGIPPDVVDQVGTAAEAVTADAARALLPPRPLAAHKGSFGHVVVAGGSPDMSGAAVLATGGALRGGAGLVTAAVPASIRDRVALAHAESMTLALPETADGTCAEAGASIVEAYARHHRAVVALGPGLSRGGESGEFARRVCRTVEAPVIVDADALNAFEDRVRDLADAPAPRVLTPHPGEAARLLGTEVAEVVGDPLEAAGRLAQATGAVVVVKGAPSVIADPRGRRWMNTTGNVGMAGGGSGDVLTGLIAALVAAGAAHGRSPLDATRLGVYLHGLAGDIAVRRQTVWGMAAGDLTRYLPRAWALAARGRSLRSPFEEMS